MIETFKNVSLILTTVSATIFLIVFLNNMCKKYKNLIQKIKDKQDLLKVEFKKIADENKTLTQRQDVDIYVTALMSDSRNEESYIRNTFIMAFIVLVIGFISISFLVQRNPQSLLISITFILYIVGILLNFIVATWILKHLHGINAAMSKGYIDALQKRFDQKINL